MDADDRGEDMSMPPHPGSRDADADSEFPDSATPQLRLPHKRQRLPRKPTPRQRT